MPTNLSFQTGRKSRSPCEISHNVFAGNKYCYHPPSFLILFLFNHIMCSPRAWNNIFILCVSNSPSTEINHRNLEKIDLSWHRVTMYSGTGRALHKLQAMIQISSPATWIEPCGVVQTDSLVRVLSHHFLVLWPWGSYLLSLSFFIYWVRNIVKENDWIEIVCVQSPLQTVTHPTMWDVMIPVINPVSAFLYALLITTPSSSASTQFPEIARQHSPLRAFARVVPAA